MKCYFTSLEYSKKVKRRKSIDFLKGRTNQISYGRFFHETKEKLEKNQPDVFKLHHSHPGQTHLIIVSENWPTETCCWVVLLLGSNML